MGESSLNRAEHSRSAEDRHAGSRVLGRFIGLVHDFFELNPGSIEAISNLDLRAPAIQVIKSGVFRTGNLSSGQLVIPELSSPLDSLEIRVPASSYYP